MSESVAATITIHLPTAAPRLDQPAPSFVLDRRIAGLRVGLRHEGSWRSWMLIIEEWTRFLVEDGAIPVVVKAGGRVGDEGQQTRLEIDKWVASIDCGISGLGTCGSCTSNSVSDAVTLERGLKPAVVAVCEEFENHGRNMATYLGHGDLKMLVFPYPLESLPADELRQVAKTLYPQFLTALGVAE